MRITAKGQVTIPRAIRERVGLLPNTEVEFGVDGETVTIRKVAHPQRPTRGARVALGLRAHGRRVTMSTEEILALTRDA